MLSRWAVEGMVVVLQFGETAAKREGVSMFVGMKPLDILPTLHPDRD